ncbi:MAG: adaptor protein MecA [Oscillospiraceae bacterium]
MKIVRLKEKIVKVILSNEDMKKLDIAYVDMDYDKPKTKTALIYVIEQVQAQIDIDFRTKKIYIEAYPYADGGCILYINFFENTALKKSNPNLDIPVIYKFDNLNNISNLAKNLSLYSKNSIYEKNGQYYLLIYTYCETNKELSHILSEYGTFFGKGTICCALIKEHFNEIISNEKNAFT